MNGFGLNANSSSKSHAVLHRLKYSLYTVDCGDLLKSFSDLWRGFRVEWICTGTHIQTYIYVYIRVCVCVYNPNIRYLEVIGIEKKNQDYFILWYLIVMVKIYSQNIKKENVYFLSNTHVI